MSRFEIRKKLRKIIRPPQKVAGVSVVFVLPDKSEHTVEVEERYTLSMASQMLKTPMETHCPDGGCGNCMVTILSGGDALHPASASERQVFKQFKHRELAANERLGCHAKLARSGAKVEILDVWKLESTRGE